VVIERKKEIRGTELARMFGFTPYEGTYIIRQTKLPSTTPPPTVVPQYTNEFVEYHSEMARIL
jgi:hypothetical protein